MGTLLVLASCSPDENDQADIGESQRTIAVIDQTTERTLVLFSTQDNADQLGAVAKGELPKTFRWISLQLPASMAPAALSDNGIDVDLAQRNDSLVFTQVYRDVCNPAADDFSACWLLERYSAGDEGLTGDIRLRSTGTQIEAQFSVQWEGITDRFDGQEQWHRHETDIAAVAAIVEVSK